MSDGLKECEHPWPTSDGRCIYCGKSWSDIEAARASKPRWKCDRCYVWDWRDGAEFCRFCGTQRATAVERPCDHVKQFDRILPYCDRCGKFWDEIDHYSAPVTRIVLGMRGSPASDDVAADRSLIIASMAMTRDKPRGVSRRVLVSPETIARNDRMWAEHDREDAERALRRRSIFSRMREWLWGAR